MGVFPFYSFHLFADLCWFSLKARNAPDGHRRVKDNSWPKADAEEPQSCARINENRDGDNVAY